jgi:release factor glutamine methyltransferase
LNTTISFASGVFRPHEGAFMLAAALCDIVKPQDSVLEIGTGSGLLGIVAAGLGAHVVATDLEEDKLTIAKNNAVANNVKIDFRQGFLAEPIGMNETFDVIVFNLPSAPTNPADKTENINESGGSDGRQLIDSFLGTIQRLLKPHSRVITVQSHLSNYAKTMASLESLGAKVKIFSERVRPLGSASLTQAEYIKHNLEKSTHPFEINGTLCYRLAVIEAEF